ncbi:ABC transporter substrate-binding protein [Bacillus sp. HMF5848]|uniref:metal ABC transporter solute-binding protein, Zn/Mn family n=1 Tax=Bacillus sp. HMF5848 TaxID=2495421 RepID=UPI000F7B7C62|nr:zinc ABC transporter substrate-binding protein [Bacillus sp. HMF5848]RSK25640.1 ABC transporter substrate-binding protein [Bacillus sp. HMF5848]
MIAKTKMLSLSFILLVGLFLAGCNSETNNTTQTQIDTNNTDNTTKLAIYTTLYPLKDFTEKIGGAYVNVTSIIPPGADAHTYEPTTKTMVDIAQADAFIYNGSGMEAYAEKISSALKNEDIKIIDATVDLSLVEHNHDHEEEAHAEDEHGHSDEEAHAEDEHGHSEEEAHAEDEHGHSEEEAHAEDEHGHSEEEAHAEDEHGHSDEEAHAEDEHGHSENAHTEQEAHSEDEHAHGDIDPHVWLDPIRSIKMAENIKNALVELMPEHQATFEQNYEALVADLNELDSKFHELVHEASQTKIVVSHAAFGYWEESYGIEQIAISGISPTDEPSQKELQKIVETAKQYNIKYVIFEQNVTPKVAELLRNEIQAEPLYLHNLSVLTEKDIENAEDYFSLMNKNIETLKIAFGNN